MVPATRATDLRARSGAGRGGDRSALRGSWTVHGLPRSSGSWTAWPGPVPASWSSTARRSRRSTRPAPGCCIARSRRWRGRGRSVRLQGCGRNSAPCCSSSLRASPGGDAGRRSSGPARAPGSLRLVGRDGLAALSLVRRGDFSSACCARSATRAASAGGVIFHNVQVAGVDALPITGCCRS